MNKLIENNLIEYNNKHSNSYSKKKERYNNWEEYCKNKQLKEMTKPRGELPLSSKRTIYLSALNTGRIKNPNVNKMNEYNIVFSDEKNKYIVGSPPHEQTNSKTATEYHFEDGCARAGGSPL